MKKQTSDYLNYCTNVTQDEFILGREKMNGSEVIVVGIPGCEEPLYTLINFKKAKHAYKIKEDEKELAKIERVSQKGTGGQPAYAMLMLAKIEKFDLKLDTSGLLMKFIQNNIQWNTGKLVRKRDDEPLTRKMISETYGIGLPRLKTMLAEMKGIVDYNPKARAFYINRSIARKGVQT